MYPDQEHKEELIEYNDLTEEEKLLKENNDLLKIIARCVLGIATRKDYAYLRKDTPEEDWHNIQRIKKEELEIK